MSRAGTTRRGLRLLRGGVLGILAALIVLPRPLPPPRDVILVSVDTLRADHLGCYGYGRPTSPYLDVLASESVRFARATAHAPNTLPSHIALLTSRLADSFARRDREAPLPSAAETLAEALAAHGFATWGFTDGGYLREEFGLAQGFEHYEDSHVGIWHLRKRIVRWLDRNADDPRRMFLFVHTYEVHSPYAPPSAYRHQFLDPANPSQFVPSTANLRAVVEGTRRLGDGDLRRIVALYDAGIRYLDDELAALFRDLDRRGRLRNAVVVVTSDHGEEFMEHNSLLHWRLFFRPNLHVPLIVRAPGLGPCVVEDVVGLIDVAPTVLDLLGLPPLAAATGRSLRPLLERGHMDTRAVYSESFALDVPHRSLVTATHQLLRREDARQPLLFDLRQDPYSTRNRSRTRRPLARRLEAELRRRRASVATARRREVAGPGKRRRIPARLRRELEALGYVE